MGEIIKNTGNEMVERWHKKMPRFFRRLAVLCTCIAGVAFAINSGLPALGGTHAGWWEDVYRYVVSACIGIVATCKLTVAGGYKDIDPDKIIQGNHILERDTPPPNMSDVETEQPEGRCP
jgi:hypothetical protein